ncbi:MAG: hypothetical protein IIZ93_10120 [Acidaminococcaceae bacterium]|nr:hypothetical protein [Acidaminococcaceae bacterium]
MFHIIEIQTTDQTSAVVTPIPVASNKTEAMTICHEKLAAAYRSQVPIHAVAIIDQSGNVIYSECAYH